MSSGDQSTRAPDTLIKSELHCLIRAERLADGTSAVIKIYRRRGLAGFLRGACFGFRAAREFAALARLERHGIPCSPPLFWKRGWSRRHGFHEVLATREIPGARALDALWRSAETARATVDGHALFQSVAAMHRCGVFHGALGPKNILAAPGPTAQGPALHLVDAARSKLFAVSIYTLAIAGYDLLQLVVKLERFLGRGACRPYLTAYGLDGAAADRLYAAAEGYGPLRRSDKLSQARLALRIECAAWSARRQPSEKEDS